MFNNDVTQTYNHQDATIEILIMLAGAFLLGCLLCWLFRKLFEENEQTITPLTGGRSRSISSDQSVSLSTAPKTPQTLTGSSTTASDSALTQTNYTRPKIDDLTKISGINTNVESELKNRGIKSYIDLRDSSKQSITGTLKSQWGKSVSAKEARTWPHQASLAAKGDWEKLKEYQDFMARSNKTAENIEIGQQKDDLKKIEGIGPKIEEVLNDNDIRTYKDLRKSNRDTLKSHLNKAGNRFEMHEPKSWPHQAGMAEREEWEELSIYQEFIDDEDTHAEPSPSATTEELKQAEVTKVKTEKVPNDDLKKIEGVGPKIEEVLNKNGIFTFKQLHQTDRDTIKKYLEDAGNQFQMHEPQSWPHQAGMADRGEWEDLKVYQEFMDGGREIPSASAFSKIDVPVQPIIDDVEADFKNEIAKDDLKETQSIAAPTHFKSSLKDQKDDLKKIEGIGPKIQELLNKAGINTFEDLKNSNRDFIKNLLVEAGPQYRMHEPETWPLQARMAFKGEWEKLEEYQDVLMGGR